MAELLGHFHYINCHLVSSNSPIMWLHASASFLPSTENFRAKAWRNPNPKTTPLPQSSQQSSDARAFTCTLTKAEDREAVLKPTLAF